MKVSLGAAFALLAVVLFLVSVVIGLFSLAPLGFSSGLVFGIACVLTVLALVFRARPRSA